MPAKLAPLALLVVALTACGTAHARPKAIAPVTRVTYKTQEVGTHGIELAVPAAWKLNKGLCGTPTANTVLWNEDGITTCLIVRPRRVSAVLFGGGVIAPTKHATRETIGGVRVVRLSESSGRDVVLDLPGRGISVTVLGPQRALVRQIVASLHAFRTDKNGCPSRTPSGGYRLGSRPRPSQRFIPSGATRLVGCYYQGRWLDVSSRVGSRSARRVARLMDNAPYGFSRAPRNTIAQSECAPSWGSFSVAHFEYANRPPVAVTVHPDGCTRLGASNGKWGVQMSHSWVPTWWRNVAYDGSIADVWGCGC
jgi:hypothetical protein